MEDSLEAELNERFASTGARLEPDVLDELRSILKLHSIDVQELWYKWESYSMKLELNDKKLDIEIARALKKDIQEGLERENRNKAHTIKAAQRGAATPRNKTNNGGMLEMLGLAPSTPQSGASNRISSASKSRRGAAVTPSMSKIKAEPTSSPVGPKVTGNSGLPFNERANSGQGVEVLNAHLVIPEPPMAPYSEPRIKLTANSDMKKLSYKTMAMKASEASEILDDRIDDFMTLVQNHHSLDDSVFGSASDQSISEVIAVGRIASDSLDGRLNISSLVLETTTRRGGGQRVPLKMTNIKNYQFFPGKIVALRGINASGDSFMVNEILDVPLLPGSASTPSELESHLQRLRGGPDAMESDSDPAPLNIIMGAGPYTADDNLDFEPLHALCNEAADSYADALILNGPFIDIDHPLIASGDFDLPDEAVSEPDAATMSTVFKYLITPAIRQLVASNPHITVLLVPSVKDAISKHVSWPQEPFPKRELNLPKPVRIIGNPMILSLNEIVLGISSQDILWELRGSEVVHGQNSEMLARLPNYMIEQRHFFPLFPPVDRQGLPKTGTEEGVPAGSMLDTSYLKLGEMINARPDILVTPSALPPFAKVVESVLVVNPGFLSKRRAAGTYAKLTVFPPKITEEERTQGKRFANKPFDRTRVDILRI